MFLGIFIFIFVVSFTKSSFGLLIRCVGNFPSTRNLAGCVGLCGVVTELVSLSSSLGELNEDKFRRATLSINRPHDNSSTVLPSAEGSLCDALADTSNA
jgi:hypothetical protein